MKVRDILKKIKADGWELKKRKGGSHRQYKHPTKPGKVTINGHPGDDLDDFLIKSIEMQSGLKLK